MHKIFTTVIIANFVFGVSLVLSPAFRRNGEGYVFTGVCLPTERGGGIPGQSSTDFGPWSFVDRVPLSLLSQVLSGDLGMNYL